MHVTQSDLIKLDAALIKYWMQAIEGHRGSKFILNNSQEFSIFQDHLTN